jgi:DNA-binding NarL/FixJ family response regulator
VIRVVLADDQALVRSGLRALLANSDDILIVGDASDGRETIAVVARTQPDVVLMDLRMPGLDGIAAIQRITADPRLSDVAIIMLTTFDEDDQIFAAIRAGASGYLLKDAEPEDVREAIRVVAAGDALVEHYAGAFPPWLAPVQVICIPVRTPFTSTTPGPARRPVPRNRT